MSVTIDVICFTSKALKNSEYPLMLRLTKDRQRKYKSLGVSVKLEDWDFSKNQPKPNTPNRDLILELSANLIGQYRKLVLEFKAESKDYTLSTLLERMDKPVKNILVGDYFLKHVSSLRAQNRTNYAASIKHTYNSLIEYNKHLNIYFPDINVAWLRNYELWMREKGLKDNTIGIRLRSLRVLYNMAVEDSIVKLENYPFDKYKVSKLYQKTAKRALTKEDVQKIINYDASCNNSYRQLAIDLFTYSYVMGGINFVDMAYLSRENIYNNQLVYYRKKTKKLIKLPIHSQADIIHQKYNGGKYIFPILSDYHKTEQQKITRVRKVITKVNRELKDIGEKLSLPIKLTTYVARHSFATVLKRSGVSTSIISESLGHSSEKITQIYLDAFENSQIDDAMKNLL